MATRFSTILRSLKPRFRPRYRRYRWILFSLLGLMLAGILGGVIYVRMNLPDFRELETTRNDLSTVIYSRDGDILGNYYSRENRIMINFNEIPPNLKSALLATEDVRFYEHAGIDLLGIFRAAYSILFKGDMQGGSTLTMQLARNLYNEQVGKSRTIKRKVKEMVAAAFLEHRYTKAEIMMHYLNTVAFGHNQHGIEAASRYYFGKQCKELATHEAALLIGMLKGTTQYSPHRNPEMSRARRNTVLSQMMRYDFLPQEKADSLQALPMNVRKKLTYSHNEGVATYFREELRKWLRGWCRKNGYNMYTDGLKVFTTIDSRMQTHAEKAVRKHLSDYQQVFNERMAHRKPWRRDTSILHRAMRRTPRYVQMRDEHSYEEIYQRFQRERKMRVFSWQDPGYIDTVMSPWDSLAYYAKYLETGVVTIEPGTGQILTWVGGIDNQFFQYDHVRQGARQVGSTFKPFVYTSAFDNKYSPCYQISNQPFTMKTADGKMWSPDNASHEYSDCMRLRHALAHSVNIPTARIMKEIGPKVVAKYAYRMGIQSELEEVPSLALGTTDLEVRELTSAYATIANMGVWMEPHFIRRIEDRNGNVLFEKTPNSREAISPETAYLMIDMLRSVVNGGTGGRIRYHYNIPYEIDIGGKTGTTQRNSDGWFMGFTPKFCTGVWVGHADRNVHFRSTRYGQGARMALPIWAHYKKAVYNDPNMNIQPERFKAPSQKMRVMTNCEKYDRMNPDQGCQPEDEVDLNNPNSFDLP